MIVPAYSSVPDYASTIGPEVGELGRLASFGPDPEQQLALDGIFGRDELGRSAAFECACVACRQNLKTGLFKLTALGWLFLLDVRLVVWSAHEFATAEESFRDLDELIGGSDYLRPRVLRVHRGNGDEAIELKTGARLIFKARTKGGGRGLSGEKVILDEAFALRPFHMGALLPLMSAQPDPQVVMGSSACREDSNVLRRLVRRGRRAAAARAAGERLLDPRLLFQEWCAPEPAQACELGDDCDHEPDTPGCGCDDPELWQLGNPALGRRILVSTIESERQALPPGEFGRERMGWHDAPVDESADPVLAPLRAKWPDLLDTDSQVEGRVALAVDVNPEASRSAVSVYGRRGDDVGHGEVIEDRAGTHWVVGRLVELCESWGPVALSLDPSGPAGRFLKALRAERLDDGRPRFVEGDNDPAEGQTRLVLVSGQTYAQACGAFADDVANGRLVHIGQKQLDDALAGARTRPLTDAWAWSRKSSSVNIAPLVSLTLARDGFAAFGGDEREVEAWVLSV